MPQASQTAATVSTALDDLAERIDELPLLPQMLVRILQLDPDSDDYFDEFERMVQQDPPFSVRVIALANSACYAPINPVVTIKSALSRLGSNTVRNLVASLAVQRVFMPTEDNQVRLWVHSVKTAVAAKHVARLIPRLEVGAEFPYLAGLLHDIGRFVMFEHAPQSLREVDESNWDSLDELVAADVEIFKFTHAELGYLACKRWGVPDELANIVRTHHDSLAETVRPGSPEAVCACVQIADRLCVSVLEHPEFGALTSDDCEHIIEKRCLPSTRERAWLPAKSLNASIDTIQSESSEILQGMGFV